MFQEYLPILNSYKAMPENYMKYSIDKHLKRWESALNHIARLKKISMNQFI
jgi:elongator complex protein 1